MATGQRCRRRKQQRRTLERRRKGLCHDCGKNKREDGLVTCRVCRKKRSDSANRNKQLKVP